MRPLTPEHEGCIWCCRGHAPTWKWDPNEPEGGTWVHVIQNKSEDGKTTQVTSAMCTGAMRPSK